MRLKGYTFAILSAVTYGLIPLFVVPLKAGTYSFDLVLFYRFFISALLILGYLIFKRESLKIHAKELGILIILGLLFSFGAECLFWSYDLLTPGIASTIFFIYPVVVALIMAFFFKERITKYTLISLFITMCGIFVLTATDSIFNINFLGLVVSLVGSSAYAVYMVIVNKAKMKVSGVVITFYSLLFTAVFYFCKVLLTKKELLIPDVGTLANITVFGLITSVISITALVAAIKLIGPTLTSIMGALEPVVAVGISVLLFHEKLTAALIYGILLILTGVLIDIIADSRKKSKISKVVDQKE